MFLNPAKSVLSLFLLLVVSGALSFGLYFGPFALSPSNPSLKEPIFINISKGESPPEISKALTSQGVVSDQRKLLLLGKLLRIWKKVKAGEYQVSAAMTPIEVLSVISSGITVKHPLTVREGENMYEIAEDLEEKKLGQKDRFVSLCKDPKFIASLGFTHPLPLTLEGYLFPDTYLLNKGMSAEEIARQMYKRFLASWSTHEEARAKELKMSRHEIVTLASMVEKETGAPQERAQISAVFYNRLKKHMRLQSDPTTIYGIWERYEGKIHKSDLQESTPYNTYTIPALPIGPIGNPGKEALQAALYPEANDYLFFVSHNDGTHQFSAKYDDHVNAVRKFQLDPKAREGKSWRDLNHKAEKGKQD